jgi:hypothetical protein
MAERLGNGSNVFQRLQATALNFKRCHRRTYQHVVREILHFGSVNRLPTPIAHLLYYPDYKQSGTRSLSKLWNYIHWIRDKRRLG